MKDKLKDVLERYKHIWKTESSFMSYIRGGIRRSLWNRSPVKLEFIKNNRYKIKNPNPNARVKEVWGGKCALTGEELPLNQLECDHIVGNHSLQSLDDLQSFIEAIVLVTEDDLQFVSKEAHKVKSYSEKMGISFEEAYAEKRAISIISSKQDKAVLEEAGIVPASNQKGRREQLVKLFMKEDN